MADIHIHRDHSLGLANARKMAWKWAEAVEEKFAMECTVVEGEGSDVVEFRRAGVDGRLVVEADAFDLTAKLGFLLGAFAGRIESEIEAQLDKLLPPAAAPGATDKSPKGAKAATSAQPAKVAPAAKAAPRPSAKGTPTAAPAKRR
jgi:putative polyhydroxyalkanoate system protein